MKKWFKFFGALAIAGVALYGYGQWSDYKLRASVEETRRQLQREGFKTELSDFNLTLPGEIRQRANVIIGAGGRARDSRALGELRLMKPLSADTALRVTSLQFIPVQSALWTRAEQEAFRQRYSASSVLPMPLTAPPPSIEEPPRTINLWDRIAEELGADGGLDAACRAVNGGEFRFELSGRNGDFLVPYLADVKRLAQALSARAAVALREHRMDDAFTNLLALTQLSTHWNPEPIEISHLVRFACVQLSQSPLWEALQSDGWSETQLATLQQEWESAEFFAGLPETAALQRASLVQICRNARADSFSSNIGGWGPNLRQIGSSILSSPVNGFRELKGLFEGYRNHVSYQNVGSYEDEKGLLLYFRDREVETKRALSCQTWEQMRPLPGATNYTVFQGAHPSRFGSLMNMRQMSLGFATEGRQPLGRAAETEARRRIMVAAIAIKRFQIRQGRNPETLAELTPALLHSVPLDFMDGKELRYRRFDDGRFILYSVGLDCTDNGGQMRTREQLRKEYELAGNYVPFTPFLNTDLVWPMPANEDEVLFYELSTDETVIHLNEVLLNQIETKYVPPRPEENVSPLRRRLE